MGSSDTPSVTTSDATTEPSPSALPDRAWWLAFHQVPFIGPARLRRLLDTFGSLAVAWQASPEDLRRCLEERPLHELVSARNRIDVAALFAAIERDGVRITTPNEESYPRLLGEIPSPPPVLYYRGELIETDAVAVAIVGTRRVTAYGREMTARIAGELARAGVTIVSGLARGVDGIAHHAALEAGGRTIAVLGSGINRIYPPEHRQLAHRIVEQGAILSDYRPDTPPDGPNFPPRNRIISGLSLGTVVVEAPERSGALITVDFAADHGRDVFAVPGPVTAPNSLGCNKLIREGARLVRTADDVLEDLQIRKSTMVQATQASLPLSDGERRLLAVLTAMPQHIDDIAVLLDVSVPEVSGQLMMLELQGLVRNSGAQYYSRT